MLTIKNASDRALYVLGWAEWPANFDVLEIVNQAGRFMYGMRSWNFTERMTGTATIVAGVNYAYPPNGCAELLGVSVANSLPHTIEWTSSAFAAEAAAQLGAQSGGSYMAYPAWIVQGAPRLVIGLWPTPQFTSTNGLNVAYRGGWSEASAEVDRSTVLAVPVFCEALYLRLVEAFALGVGRREGGNTDELLAQIVNGPLYQQAARADAAVVTDGGAIRNGALGSASRSGGSSWGVGSLQSSFPMPS